MKFWPKTLLIAIPVLTVAATLLNTRDEYYEVEATVVFQPRRWELPGDRNSFRKHLECLRGNAFREFFESSLSDKERSSFVRTSGSKPSWISVDQPKADFLAIRVIVKNKDRELAKAITARWITKYFEYDLDREMSQKPKSFEEFMSHEGLHGPPFSMIRREDVLTRRRIRWWWE